MNRKHEWQIQQIDGKPLGFALREYSPGSFTSLYLYIISHHHYLIIIERDDIQKLMDYIRQALVNDDIRQIAIGDETNVTSPGHIRLQGAGGSITMGIVSSHHFQVIGFDKKQAEIVIQEYDDFIKVEHGQNQLSP